MENVSTYRVLVYGLVGGNQGGIETFLLKMSEHMSQYTIFDYVVEGNFCMHKDKIKNLKGNIFYVNARYKHPLFNIIDNYRLLKKVKNQYKTVYFNLSALSWIAPVIIARLFKYNVYVHAHNAEFVRANSDFAHKIVNKINKFILKKANCKRLTCSYPATEFIFGKNASVTMIYNAIDVRKFAFNSEIRNVKKKEFGISETTKIIGFVGRLNDQKNPLYLAKILKSTLEIRKDVLLMVLGDGPMKNELKKEFENLGVSGNVLMLGNRMDVSELMSCMDVFVLPSLHEGLPYVVVEAQSCGLKCLLSDNITKEVDATGNVVFLDINNSGYIWSEAINTALQEKDIDRMEYNRRMIDSVFNIEMEAKKLELILRNGC